MVRRKQLSCAGVTASYTTDYRHMYSVKTRDILQTQTHFVHHGKSISKGEMRLGYAETEVLLDAQQGSYDADLNRASWYHLHARKSGVQGWCVGKHAWSHWPSSCAAVAGGCWGWEGAVQCGAPEGGCLSAPRSACCSPITDTHRSGSCHLLADLQMQQHTSIAGPQLQDPGGKN